MLDIRRFTSSSSTNNTRGGTAQPGTKVDLRTRSFWAVVGREGAAGGAEAVVEAISDPGPVPDPASGPAFFPGCVGGGAETAGTPREAAVPVPTDPL